MEAQAEINENQSNVEEPKGEELISEEKKTEEVQDEPKPEEGKPEENQVKETKTEETKVEETKSEEEKAEEERQKQEKARLEAERLKRQEEEELRIYQKLQGDYDYVIAGTGPIEAFLSAMIARTQKADGHYPKILHVDKLCAYGGFMQTWNLKDFREYLSTKGTIPIDKIDEYYKETGKTPRYSDFQFDSFPLTIYSRDKLIGILINSKNSEMAQISCYEGLYFYGTDSFRPVPCSKGSIVSDRSIPLKQKRVLMKFLQSVFPHEQYGHEQNTQEMDDLIKEYSDKPFAEFMNKLGFDDQLSGGFEYLVASAVKPLKTSEGVDRIRFFAESLGVYGQTPFITLHYGTSDLPQMFCRNSAIYRGIFALGQNIQECSLVDRDPSETPSQNSEPSENPENDKPIFNETDTKVYKLKIGKIGNVRARRVILGKGQIGGGEKKLLFYRENIVLKEPLVSKPLSIAIIPPGRLGNEATVSLVQEDSSLYQVPRGLYLLQIWSKQEMDSVIDQLLKGKEDTILFRGKFILEEENDINVPDGIFFTRAPSADDMSFGSNFYVDQTTELLEQILPGTPLFPPPTEVEIEVYDEEPQKKVSNEKEGEKTPADTEKTEKVDDTEKTEKADDTEKTEKADDAEKTEKADDTQKTEE